MLHPAITTTILFLGCGEVLAQDPTIAVKVRGAAPEHGRIVVVCAPRPSALSMLPEQPPLQAVATAATEVEVRIRVQPDSSHLVYAFTTDGERARVSTAVATWSGERIELDLAADPVPRLQLECKGLADWQATGDLRLLATCRGAVLWTRPLRGPFDGVIPPLPATASLSLLSPTGQILATTTPDHAASPTRRILVELDPPRTTTVATIAGARERERGGFGQEIALADPLPASVTACNRFLAAEPAAPADRARLRFAVAEGKAHREAAFGFLTADGVFASATYDVNWTAGRATRLSNVSGFDPGRECDVVVPMLRESSVVVDLSAVPLGTAQDTIALCRGSSTTGTDGRASVLMWPVRGRRSEGNAVRFGGLLPGTKFLVTCLPSHGGVVVGPELLVGFGVVGTDDATMAGSCLCQWNITMAAGAGQPDDDLIALLAPASWGPAPELGFLVRCRPGKQTIRLPAASELNLWVFAGSGHSGFARLRCAPDARSEIDLTADVTVACRMLRSDRTAMAGAFFRYGTELGELSRFWPNEGRVPSDADGLVKIVMPAALSSLWWSREPEPARQTIPVPAAGAPATTIQWPAIGR
jgi:hypothetical protein